MTYVIDSENLGKKYVLSQNIQGSSTLVDSITGWVKGGCSFKSKSQETEDFWALKDLTFKIEEGDRLGIIGKNGAGKSTLLKVLSRITEPSHGSVKVRGRVSSLLEVGTGFHPELTGRENIFLNGAILGMANHEIKKKFDEIVDFAEVEKFLDTPVKRYSSGMFTRLGFAIAANLDPDLLIVDEVLAVGDQQFQEKCLKKLSDLGKVGRTVLFVSHDIGNILSLCNKGLWLEKGEMKHFGPVEESVSAYMKSLKTRPLTWEGVFGDEHIIFTKFSLSGGSNEEYFLQTDQPKIELEYEVLERDPDLLLGFSIFNRRNQLIARSHTADSPETMGHYNTLGKHKVTFPLSAALFNEGEYYIRLECVVHNKKQIINDDIFLKFPVFAHQKNTRYSHLADMGGIYLGNHWQKF